MASKSKLEVTEKEYLRIPFVLSIILIVVHFIQYYLGVNLNGALGLKPREFEGLLGVIFTPFLHGSFSHLFSNLFSFFFLIWALRYFYHSISKEVLIAGWVATGLWTWVFANSGVHVGASGIVYFLVVFLFLSGVFRKEKSLIALSLAVIFYHAGIIWGVIPWEEVMKEELWRLNSEQLRSIQKVSWESHLMGVLSGLVLAIYYRRKGPQKKEVPMNDDVSHLEAKYGENFWDPEKRKLPEQQEPVTIRYIFKRKDNEASES